MSGEATYFRDHEFDKLGLDKREFKAGDEIEGFLKAWMEASEADAKKEAKERLTKAVQGAVEDLEYRYRNADAYGDDEVMRYTRRMQGQWKKWSNHHKVEITFDELD